MFCIMATKLSEEITLHGTTPKVTMKKVHRTVSEQRAEEHDFVVNSRGDINQSILIILLK